MYSVRRSLNAACACRLRCLRSSTVEWTCTCQFGMLCADLAILTGFFTPLPAKRSSVRAYAMSLAFKKFIDSNWTTLRLDLDTRGAESSRLLNRKKMFQKSSIYTESIGGQLRIKFFPENFFEGKSLEGGRRLWRKPCEKGGGDK
jgi:hypothetical protein